MRTLLVLMVISAAVGCSETKEQKAVRYWLNEVMRETNEGNVGIQLANCLDPPPNAPEKGVRQCTDFDAWNAIAIARRGEEARPYKKRGPSDHCEWLLDALSLARRDSKMWEQTKKWASERCCEGPGDYMKPWCDAIGAWVGDITNL